MEAVESARQIGEAARESLVFAVARSLEQTLARRDLTYLPEGQTRARALEQAASVFVDQVWAGTFRGRFPPSRRRRVAFAIYAWAFKRRAAELLSQKRSTPGRGATLTHAGTEA